MSIFDRKRPLKTLRRYLERTFQKKYSEKIDFTDTTIHPVGLFDDGGEGGRAPGMPGFEDDTIEEGAVSTAISDQDGDTKVDTEQAADEDKIRFKTANRERFRMEANDTNGAALYIAEGSGTTAPGTPTSGYGVLYEKNDGKVYFKNDAGTEYDLTSAGGGGTSRVIISHTWAIGGAVAVASGDTDYIIPMTVRNTYTGAGYSTTVKVVSVIASIKSGTNVTWKLQKNGSDLSGYGTSGSPLTATTTPATTEGTETLADKDELAPVVVGVSSSPKNWSVTVFLEITGA